MGKGMQGILRGLIQAGMYLAYRPKVVYKNQQAMEVMNGDAPVVFICNHMSHKDGALIASVLHKKQPYFLIAKDWYEKKQFEGFLRTYGSVPVDRTGMDTSWYDACRKLLEAGHSILIFPEGKTSKGEMNAFQPGFAVLAEKTGAKVVGNTCFGSSSHGRTAAVIMKLSTQCLMKESETPYIYCNERKEEKSWKEQK